MRVKLAAQVMSNSISKGMKVLSRSGNLDTSIGLTFENTAEYFKFFNDLFDVFNKSDACAFNRSDEQLGILREASQLLSTIRIFDDKGADITGLFKFIKLIFRP